MFSGIIGTLLRTGAGALGALLAQHGLSSQDQTAQALGAATLLGAWLWGIYNKVMSQRGGKGLLA